MKNSIQLGRWQVIWCSPIEIKIKWTGPLWWTGWIPRKEKAICRSWIIGPFVVRQFTGAWEEMGKEEKK